mgnify:CR=1 FL=1
MGCNSPKMQNVRETLMGRNGPKTQNVSETLMGCNSPKTQNVSETLMGCNSPKMQNGDHWGAMVSVACHRFRGGDDPGDELVAMGFKASSYDEL